MQTFNTVFFRGGNGGGGVGWQESQQKPDMQNSFRSLETKTFLAKVKVNFNSSAAMLSKRKKREKLYIVTDNLEEGKVKEIMGWSITKHICGSGSFLHFYVTLGCC